jgi:hypothetical protein
VWSRAAETREIRSRAAVERAETQQPLGPELLRPPARLPYEQLELVPVGISLGDESV